MISAGALLAGFVGIGLGVLLFELRYRYLDRHTIRRELDGQNRLRYVMADGKRVKFWWWL